VKTLKTMQTKATLRGADTPITIFGLLRRFGSQPRHSARQGPRRAEH